MSDLNEAINVSLNVLYVEHCENCDESTGHICEMCFVHETLLKLHAEVERLREALKETAVAAVRCRNRNQTRIADLREEVERVQCGWNTPDTKPGDGDSIWVEVIEHDGVNRHVDYAVTWVDYDGLQVRRFEQISRMFCQIWPPEDVIRWCHCRVPQSSIRGDDDE